MNVTLCYNYSVVLWQTHTINIIYVLFYLSNLIVIHILTFVNTFFKIYLEKMPNISSGKKIQAIIMATVMIPHIINAINPLFLTLSSLFIYFTSFILFFNVDNDIAFLDIWISQFHKWSIIYINFIIIYDYYKIIIVIIFKNNIF